MIKKNLIKYLTPLAVIFSTFSISSCGEKPFVGKVHLDYGTFRETEVVDVKTEVNPSTYDEVVSKINKKESFPLIIYSNGCTCWTQTFSPQITTYINETGVDFTLIDVTQFQFKNNLGLYLVASDMPSIAIFNNGKLVIQTVYERDDKKVFSSYSHFKEFMEKHTALPCAYYINKDILTNFIEENKKFNLYVTKKSCPDCARANPLYYTWNDNKENLENKLFIFDIQPYVSSPDYQDIKDELGLSELHNPTLGYGQGYVPAFQVREGRNILDMIVTHNDSYDNTTKKMSSYFTQDRVENMPFLINSEIQHKVLDDMYIENYDRDIYEQTYINPIINLFFDTYLK